MKENLKITKYERVENTDQESKENGVVAFQLVNFQIHFYANEMEPTHDTKIMSDGRQIVIDGCGFIEAGYEL